MFRFGDLNRVIWPVQIGDGEIRVAFDIYSRKELHALERDAAAKFAARVEAGGTPRSAEDYAALLEAAAERDAADEADLLARVKDWYDIEDLDGQPLAFTTARLQALLDTDYGFRAFRTALLEASRAGPAKNSQPGPGGMPARDQA